MCKKSRDHLFAVCAITVTASSDYIAQFMPDRTNAVQLHAICTEVALVHLGGVVAVKKSAPVVRSCQTAMRYSISSSMLDVFDEQDTRVLYGL